MKMDSAKNNKFIDKRKKTNDRVQQEAPDPATSTNLRNK